MNILKGNIDNVIYNEGLCLLNIVVCGTIIKAMILANKNDGYKKGASVDILFKETEAILSKEYITTANLPNQIPCKVIAVKKGKLLQSVKLKCFDSSLVSVVTLNDFSLTKEEEIYLLLRANQIMISR